MNLLQESKIKCIMCGDNRKQKILTGKDNITNLPGIFSVMKCENCGLCWTEPQLSKQDLTPYYGDEYPINISPKQSDIKINFIMGWKRTIMNTYAKILYDYYVSNNVKSFCKIVPFLLVSWKLRGTLPHNGGARRVMDIGFGRGAFLIGAYKQGWECYGIEPNGALCQYVRQILPSAEITNGFVEDFEYPENFFSFINMSHVLEHLHDPVCVLKKINRWLSPEGVLRIKIPCMSSLEIKLFGSYWPGWELPRHLYHFDSDSLKRILKVSGFKVVGIHYEANINNWIWSLKYLAKKRNISKRLIDILDVENKLLTRLLLPLGWFLKMTRMSGRIGVLCVKALEKPLIPNMCKNKLGMSS